MMMWLESGPKSRGDAPQWRKLARLIKKEIRRKLLSGFCKPGGFINKGNKFYRMIKILLILLIGNVFAAFAQSGLGYLGQGGDKNNDPKRSENDCFEEF